MVCLKIFHKFDTTYQSSCFYYSFLKWLIFQMDFECFIGTLNVFLSPRQVHLLTELASGFSSPGLFWGNVSWGHFFFAGFTIRKEDKGPPIVKAELEKRRLADTHFIISLVVFYLILYSITVDCTDALIAYFQYFDRYYNIVPFSLLNSHLVILQHIYKRESYVHVCDSFAVIICSFIDSHTFSKN